MRLLQGFTSPPVQLNLGDLTLKRGGGTTGAAAPAKKLAGGDLVASNPLANMPSSLPPPQAATDAADDSSRAFLSDLEDAAAEAGAAAVPVPVEDQAVSGRAAEKQGKATMGMAKKYGAGFIWGQLNGWYKQTVFDPTASLSAERRGTISMPDIESLLWQLAQPLQHEGICCRLSSSAWQSTARQLAKGLPFDDDSSCSHACRLC